MGSGLSVDADAESAYSFIACAEFCAKKNYPKLTHELRKSHIGVRVSRSALLHTRRREIAMIREIPDTEEMEAAEMHVLKRGIEFERGIARWWPTPCVTRIHPYTYIICIDFIYDMFLLYEFVFISNI